MTIRLPKLLFYLWLVASLILGGVVIDSIVSTRIHSNNNETDECLPAEFSVGYPYKNETKHTPTPFPIPTNWQLVLEIPLPEYYSPGNLTIESNGDIWVLVRDPIRTNNQLLHIVNDRGQVDPYEIETTDERPVALSKLMLTKNNDLWVFGDYKVDQIRKLYIGAFQRDTQTFTSIPGLDFIAEDNISQSNVIEDNNGNFWFILGESLMQFDPDNLTIHKVDVNLEHSLFPNSTLNYQTIALDENDNLWMMVYSKSDLSASEKYGLISYDIKNSEVKFHGSPPGLSDWYTRDTPDLRILIDHIGRIWVSQYGWYSQLEGWYKLILPPLFIASVPDYFYQYSEWFPRPVMETEDRFIWFSSVAGIARLDMETNQWCLVSRIGTNAFGHDIQNNIWAIFDHQLYRFKQN